MPTNFNIPFLPQTATSDSILQAIQLGLSERQRDTENRLRQQQLGTEQQNVTSEIGLRGAQQQQIEEEMHRKRILAGMFEPGQAATPGQAGAAPQSWWDSNIDNAELPDGIKANLKIIGRIGAKSGDFALPFDAFSHALQANGKKARPAIIEQNGQPVAISDEQGTPWDINDPQLPDNLKAMAKNAQSAFANRTPPSEEEREFQRAVKEGTYKENSADRMKFHQAWAVKPVQPGQSDARMDRSYQFNSTQLERVRTPIDQRSERLTRVTDAINQRDPQADSLIAPELLSVMAGGQGSGLRMNEAEISRIVGGRSNWEAIQAAVNKWKPDDEALSITDSQRAQIQKLLATVSQRVQQKQQILSDAENELIAAPSVSEHRRIVAETRQKLAAIDSGQGDQASAAPKIPAGARAVRQNGQVVGYTVDGKTMIPVGSQ